MHDERLSRTTNVKEVFPAQAHLNASTFNWTELQQLDAGSWFLEVRACGVCTWLAEPQARLCGVGVMCMGYLKLAARLHGSCPSELCG